MSHFSNSDWLALCAARSLAPSQYFVRLLEEKWVPRRWAGPLQFADAKTGDLMMLPSDMALVEDPVMAKHCKTYAGDAEAFSKDFSAAFAKLLELGVPFAPGTAVIKFKTT